MVICGDCGEREAAVFIRRSAARGAPGRADLALCESCARSRGVVAGPGGLDLSLGTFLDLILREGKGDEQRPLACPSCGADVGLVEVEGRLGCPACAQAFRPEIGRLLAARDSARNAPRGAARSGAGPNPPLSRDEGRRAGLTGGPQSSSPSFLALQLPAFDGLDPRAPEGDVVLRSLLRVSRNFADLAFPGSPAGGPSPCAGRAAALLASLPGWESRALRDMAGPPRLALAELAGLPRSYSAAPGAVFAASLEEPLYALEDETDHLRVFARLPGLSLGAAARLALACVEGLEARPGVGHGAIFASDPEFGWLCARLEDCGPGVSASALVHLPALAMAGLQDKLFRALLEGGVQIRGVYAEEGASIGSLFEIVASGAAGASPGEISAAVESAALTAAAAERRARAEIASRDPDAIRDAAGRALGILAHSRRLGLEEASSHLSALRLAAQAGLLRGADPDRLGDLLGRLGPGALAAAVGGAAAEGRVDAELTRAAFLRRETRAFEEIDEEDVCSRA